MDAFLAFVGVQCECSEVVLRFVQVRNIPFAIPTKEVKGGGERKKHNFSPTKTYSERYHLLSQMERPPDSSSSGAAEAYGYQPSYLRNWTSVPHALLESRYDMLRLQLRSSPVLML